MWPAFPTSDYYGSSAPSHRHRPAMRLPAGQPAAARKGDRRDGSHVHSRTVRRGRRPAMPLQHRHGYAAGIHCGLPTGDINRPRSSPTANATKAAGRVRAAIQPRSARLELVALLRAFSRWFLTYAFPSRLPDPGHLAVLARPVVVRAASALLRIPRDELPSAAPARCDGPAAVSSHHRSVQERLVALDVGNPQLVRPGAGEVAL